MYVEGGFINVRSEWQCAGILCQRILCGEKEKVQLIVPAERKKKVKIAEEENGLEPERVHAHHLGLRRTP